MSATIPPNPAQPTSGFADWSDGVDNVRELDLEWIQNRTVIRFENQAALDAYAASPGRIDGSLGDGQLVYLISPKKLMLRNGGVYETVTTGNRFNVTEASNTVTLSNQGAGGLSLQASGAVAIPNFTNGVNVIVDGVGIELFSSPSNRGRISPLTSAPGIEVTGKLRTVGEIESTAQVSGATLRASTTIAGQTLNLTGAANVGSLDSTGTMRVQGTGSSAVHGNLNVFKSVDIGGGLSVSGDVQQLGTAGRTVSRLNTIPTFGTAVEAGRVNVSPATGILQTYYTPTGGAAGWRLPWNMPWGVVARNFLSTHTSVLANGTWQDIGLSVTMNIIAGRLYKITYKAGSWADTTPSNVAVRVLSGSDAVYDQMQLVSARAGLVGFNTGQTFFDRTSNTTNFVLRVQAQPQDGTSVRMYATGGIAITLIVEDIGPA